MAIQGFSRAKKVTQKSRVIIYLSYEAAYRVLELPDDVELIVRWPDGNESVHHGPIGDKRSSPGGAERPQKD